MPVIKTYFGFYLGVGGGRSTGLSLEAGYRRRVTGYLAMFVSKYFKNITLKMFTAYPFFS